MASKLGNLSRNVPFKCINILQCYELTRRRSHLDLLFTQISPLTYAVYLWPVHCECAMNHNRREIFNYLQIRDITWLVLCIVGGVYEQDNIVEKCRVDDWTTKTAIIASKVQ